ncbi:hypothetical protein [Haloferula sp. BvORR071]|uniref:hypothetical protein n=1 Tax=Haloferula sp. BvORR071 TaxID=1396141 RepID=UPI0005578812|nr:hypothetical protein [Haloferula sp. BvORR071]
MGELVASRVELTYYTRSGTGLPTPQVQADGVAAPGKVQVIAISGPERDTFVPKDDLDSFDVQTVNANVTIGTLRPTILSMLPEVVTSRAGFAGKPGGTDVTLANGETLDFDDNKNPSSVGSSFSLTMPALTMVDAATGAAVSRIGKNLVITPDAPDWLSLPGMQRVKLSGRIYVLAAQTSAKSPYGVSDNIDSAPPPAWANAFPWSLKQSMTRSGDPPPYWMSITTFPQPSFYIRHQNQLWALDFEIEAVVTTTAYAALTSFYKPPEFEYLTPPANMAKALRSMQSWTPCRGTLTRKGKELCNGAQMLNCKFNLSGARAALATMGALPKAVSYDFRSKELSIELGPPSRFDTRSLAQRFRQPAQTNITYTP